MSICYEFEIEAGCPVDGTRDHYAVRVDAHEMIEVEHLVAVAEAMSHRVIFQEKLTKELHLLMPVACSVTTVGMHSDVRVTVMVES